MTTLGTLYGVGVGPGDPELMTLKAAAVVARCRQVFAPKAEPGSESLARSIAGRHIAPDATVHELHFPMVVEKEALLARWREAARQVAEVLEAGEDACFLTLGDPLLYSTYVYLLRALRARLPEVRVVTVPGVTAFCAAAALTEFPVGEGKEPVAIIPTADDLESVRSALARGGTVVLMKIGKRLPAIIELLEQTGAVNRAVLVARAGLDGQRIETDLRSIRGGSPEAGYLSVILVHASEERRP